MLTRKELAATLQYIAELLFTNSEPGVVHPVEEPTAETKRLGRPRKGAAVPTVETPATEVASAPQEHTAEAKPVAPAVKGKTLEELKALIQPLIKAARGTEVKKVINDHAPEGHSGDYTLSALSEHPEKHDSFVSAIEMLSM